jgi:hypothetical protein
MEGGKSILARVTSGSMAVVVRLGLMRKRLEHIRKNWSLLVNMMNTCQGQVRMSLLRHHL